jgi:hypothetical protein
MARHLPHVLWIGGAPGTGKTSIGRRLAHRHDLRAYNADAYTWAHHDRAVARGDAAAARWESMTPDERWLDMPAADMAAFSLEMNAERFRLMVEDVEGLPDEPFVVMEGTPLLPWLVEERLADPAQAVWLLPTPEFQRARLLARPTATWDATSDPRQAVENRIERERLVGEAIDEAARSRGYTTLTVDETRDLATMKAAVEELFAPVLERGVGARSREQLSAMRRAENLVVLRQVETYLEREPAAGKPETAEFPFSCECGTSGCELTPVATIAGYRRLVERGEPLVGEEAPGRVSPLS